MRTIPRVSTWLVTLLFVGCNDDACTEIGCNDGLSVLIRPAAERFLPGHYEVSVAVAGEARRSCYFVISNDPDICALDHCVEVEDCNAMYSVGYPVPERVEISYPVIEAPVDLQVKRDGAVLVQMAVEPAYHEMRPNGPGCPPTCHRASVELHLPETPNSVLQPPAPH
jgi:hypothetical protein